MDWGSGITYLAHTPFKGKDTRFGIKDQDRLEHISIIGKTGSGRAAFLSNMALQDIERGVGTLILDAAGTVVEILLERLGEEARSRLIYLDPSDAEYPFSWNALDDFRADDAERTLPLLVETLSTLYRLSVTVPQADIPLSPLLEFAAARMLAEKDATPLFLYDLIQDPVTRQKVAPKDTPAHSALESLLKDSHEIVERVIANGRYLAKDTLMRNLLGQHISKFTLGSLYSGGIFVIDLSRIRMFPTRITPLVRLFINAARARTRSARAPVALYLHNCLRSLSEEDLGRALLERKIALTLSDSVLHEEDIPLREKILARSASIIAFSPNPVEAPLLEKTFFPYIGQEDFQKLDVGEIATLLSIDSVRSRPFFARSLKLPDRMGVSYHDIQVAAREKYTTPRHIVDLSFIRPRTPDGKGKDPDTGSFSNAFRSIFAKGAEPGSSLHIPSSGSAKPLPQGAKAAPKTEGKADANRTPSEIPEDELRQMLYVEPFPS